MSKNYLISIPPYTFNINSNIKSVKDHVSSIYYEYEKPLSDEFVDFNVSITPSNFFRKWYKPQVRFFNDDNEPFYPLPFSQSHAFLEWGMNWCVAATEANWLIIHAAILAKDDQAIVFPAPPGSGKSTLTAYLALNGWRLLSDEMTIIELNTCKAIPFVRPISLKNNSISLVKSWFPDVIMSDIAKDTTKGDVAHVKAPSESIANAKRKATIKAIVFPKYNAAKVLDIYELNQSNTFMQLAKNAFNYNVIGEDAFSTISHIVEKCPGFEIEYNDVEEVESFLQEELVK